MKAIPQDIKKLVNITLKESHEELYDACKSILVMVDFYQELQLDVEWFRIDSPRLILIRQAVLNAERLLEEMGDE